MEIHPPAETDIQLIPLLSYESEFDALPFNHRLRDLSSWPVHLARPTDKDALTFFYGVFTGRGATYNRSDVQRLLPKGTKFLAVTCDAHMGPNIVALIGYRTEEVDGKLVSYVPLLGVSDTKASKAAYGDWADAGPWEKRGLGRFLLHRLQRETRSQAGLRPWQIELQSSEAMRGWYKRGSFYLIERLTLNVTPEEQCTPMRFADQGLCPLSSWSAMDRYLNFVGGVDLTVCGGGSPVWWEQIKDRQTGAPFIDETLGYSLHTYASIESDGWANVYGGDFHRGESAERVPSSHKKALPGERRDAVIDGRPARNAAMADQGTADLLPRTHWGPLANADIPGNARFESVWPFGELTPPVCLVRVGANGIQVRDGTPVPITINYPIDDHDISGGGSGGGGGNTQGGSGGNGGSTAVGDGIRIRASSSATTDRATEKLYPFAFGDESVQLRLSDLLCPDAHPDMVDYNAKVLCGSYLGVSKPVTAIRNEPGLLASAKGVECLLLLEGHSDAHVQWESRTSIAGNRMKLVGTRDWHTGFEKYDLTATGRVLNKEQRNHTLLVEGSAFVKEWIPHTEAIKGDDYSIGAVFLVSLLRCAEATI